VAPKGRLAVFWFSFSWLVFLFLTDSLKMNGDTASRSWFVHKAIPQRVEAVIVRVGVNVFGMRLRVAQTWKRPDCVSAILEDDQTRPASIVFHGKA